MSFFPKTAVKNVFNKLQTPSTIASNACKLKIYSEAECFQLLKFGPSA